MITEAEVQRSYRKLSLNISSTETEFDNAEELVEQLRLESPLRHRLLTEIDELRELAAKS